MLAAISTVISSIPLLLTNASRYIASALPKAMENRLNIIGALQPQPFISPPKTVANALKPEEETFAAFALVLRTEYIDIVSIIDEVAISAYRNGYGTLIRSRMPWF